MRFSSFRIIVRANARSCGFRTEIFPDRNFRTAQSRPTWTEGTSDSQRTRFQSRKAARNSVENWCTDVDCFFFRSRRGDARRDDAHRRRRRCERRGRRLGIGGEGNAAEAGEEAPLETRAETRGAGVGFGRGERRGATRRDETRRDEKTSRDEDDEDDEDDENDENEPPVRRWFARRE